MVRGCATFGWSGASRPMVRGCTQVARRAVHRRPVAPAASAHPATCAAGRPAGRQPRGHDARSGPAAPTPRRMDATRAVNLDVATGVLLIVVPLAFNARLLRARPGVRVPGHPAQGAGRDPAPVRRRRAGPDPALGGPAAERARDAAARGPARGSCLPRRRHSRRSPSRRAPPPPSSRRSVSCAGRSRSRSWPGDMSPRLTARPARRRDARSRSRSPRSTGCSAWASASTSATCSPAPGRSSSRPRSSRRRCCPAWLGIVGIPIGVALLVGTLEFVGPNERDGWPLAGTIVPIAYIAWSVWLILLGVLLLV